MRLFVILLLVALTAVRSWAGDVMAIQMAMAAPTSVVATGSAHEDCMGAHTHDHDHEDAHVHTATPDDTQQAQDHCDNCASCQACFTVALSTPSLQLTFQAPSHIHPYASVTAFTSAVPALGQKPPIS
jgi:ABC-type nickel/cobalt efflux system permease component RcnA